MRATDPTLTLYDMLRSLSTDMHQASTRPCQTCHDLTDKLGWPFGCYEYRALIKSSQPLTVGLR